MKYIFKLTALLTVMAITLSSCWENVEDIKGSGEVVAPGVKIVVLDADATRQEGLNVSIHADYEAYIDGTALGTGTTDSNGEVEFGTDVLGNEEASFYVNVSNNAYTKVNWDGTVETANILFAAGKTPVPVTVAAPSYSTAITGNDEVVSGSTHTFSLADYPGTYTWSSNSSNAVFSDATVPVVSVSFTQNTAADETITLSVDIEAGTDSRTLTMDVLSTQFCTYDPALWEGATITGADGCGIGWSSAAAVVADGNTITLPADAGGNPTVMRSIFAGWGETFQAGFGNEGDVVFTFNDDGSIDLPAQYWGQTLPGPYDYWVQGSGNFDQCTGTVTLTEYILGYAEDFSSASNCSGVTFTID